MAKKKEKKGVVSHRKASQLVYKSNTNGPQNYKVLFFPTNN